MQSNLSHLRGNDCGFIDFECILLLMDKCVECFTLTETAEEKHLNMSI